MKAYARESRGMGKRYKVTMSGKVPRDWKTFMRNDNNKSELFCLLAKSICTIEDGIVYASYNETSICNKLARQQIPCTHEEADTRIFVHLKNAIERDCISSACIMCNDTDIVILATAFFKELEIKGLQKLWVSFGIGRNRRWIPIHDLSISLGPSKCKGLLFFHALSGCDNVSGFKGKGKKSFYQTWSVFPEITETFVRLSQFPVCLEEKDIQILEKIIALLYDKSSTTESVDTTRKLLFMHKNTQFDFLPPTFAALKQHISRAVYQASIIWGQALELEPVFSCPKNWGWKINADGSWDIHWTELSAISDVCSELCKCACKTSCGSRCSCKKSNLQCTSICSCSCV